MDLCSKYKPLCISELEIEYPKIKEYLNLNKTFIVNGQRYCGKSTIVKLYLEKLNYDYLLIDDFNLSKESIIDKIKYRTDSVFSYFYNKKFTVIIDNFELFDNSVKDYILSNYNKHQYVIITYKFLTTKINYVKIYNYSYDYLLNLYTIMYFLEKSINCDNITKFQNINQMFSILELNLCSISSSELKEPENNCIIFDKYNYKYKDFICENNFLNKLYILDKIDSYNVFQHNLIYNYKHIDDLANGYDYLSESLFFYGNNNSSNNNNYVISLEYYSILSMIGSSFKLNNYEIHKENFQIKKINKKLIKKY